MPTRRRGLTVLGATAAIWFFAKFLRYALPPLFDTFRVSLGVTNAFLGLAFSGMMLVYAAAQFPSGLVADRRGPVTVIAAGAIVAGLGAAIVGTLPEGSAGLVPLVVGMVVFGAGSGVHKTVAVTLLTGVTERGGRAVGVLDTFGTLGGVLAPVAVVAMLSVSGPGWRVLFLAGGVATAAAGIWFWVSTDGIEGQTDRTDVSLRASLAGYRDAVRDPRVAGFVLVSVAFSFAYNGVVAFLPSYLDAIPGVTASVAAVIYGGFFAVSLVQPLAGTAADRWGTLPTASAALVAAALGMVGVVIAGDLLSVAAAALVVGAGSHAFRPVRGTHLIAIAPGETAGGTLGVARTALMGAGALAPAAVGATADAAGYWISFLLPTGALLIAAVGVLVLLLTEPN